MITIEDDQYGNALYSFVQALLKISDVSFLSRERWTCPECGGTINVHRWRCEGCGRGREG
jgi:ribosomal protein L37AE/L43A